MPQPQVSPIDSPLNPSRATKSFDLPSGSVQVGEALVFDFDGDDQIETARAYTASGGGLGGGVMMTKPSPSGEELFWQVNIPPDLKLLEIKARDMQADGIYEILIFTQKDGQAKFPLYVYKRVNGAFTLLKPNGGKLAGQDAFVSDYWPTTLGDVDGDGIMEIVPTLELEPPVEYLEPNVYQWDGTNFTFTDYFIVPPRFKP
jgi:hypothetical protein